MNHIFKITLNVIKSIILIQNIPKFYFESRLILKKMSFLSILFTIYLIIFEKC